MSDTKTQKMREPIARKLAIALATSVVNELNDIDLMASCITCIYFDEGAVWCRQFGGHPPPRIIAYACGGYTDEAIPPFD